MGEEPPEEKYAGDDGDDEVEEEVEVGVEVEEEQEQEQEEEQEEGQEEEDDDESTEAVTAETVMGFPTYPNSTNGEIMTEHHGFVRWAKSKAEEARGNLAIFLEWAESDEGKRLEVVGQGKEHFTYGRHKDKTFEEVAACDPGYHTRYMYMINKNGGTPSSQLTAYISWYEDPRRTMSSSTSSVARMQANRSTSHSHTDGNERFSMGLHRDQTFREVAQEDPSYHLRCNAKGQTLKGELFSYIRYFNRFGDHAAAHRDEMDTIAYYAGIWCPHCCDDCYG